MPVPVNLITGMLGAGKTTTILHLLSHRPADEHWAVLVNDFGAVGIDAGLLQPEDGKDLVVREVSGGCICCTAALHLRQGLIELLRARRADRLLIEPSGLGHPAAILDLLAEPGLATHVEPRAVIGVFDPAAFTAERHDRSDLYREQLELTDVAVLNRCDLVDMARIEALRQWFESRYPPPLAVVQTRNGAIDPELLDSGHTAHATRPGSHLESTCVEEEVLPGGAIHRRLHSDEGVTLGWIWPPEWRWHAGRIRPWLDSLATEPDLLRLKGILRTGRQWQRLDIAGGVASVRTVNWRRDSRLEVIVPDEDAATILRGRIEFALEELRYSD